jgi:hypothetical protein
MKCRDKKWSRVAHPDGGGESEEANSEFIIQHSKLPLRLRTRFVLFSAF